MPRTRVPLGIGDRDVPVPSHICLFYDDEVELRERLSFLVLGLDDPTQACVLFGKHERLSEIVGYLIEDGPADIERAITERRLVLVEAASTGDATLAHIGHTLDDLVAGGAEVIRFLGFIAWGDPAWPTDRDLMEFEAKVNRAVVAYPAVIVCSYKLDALAGPVLIHSGIETHPLTVLRGKLHDNPHYIAPDDYLVRLAAESGSPATTGVPLSSLSGDALDELVRRATRGPGVGPQL